MGSLAGGAMHRPYMAMLIRAQERICAGCGQPLPGRKAHIRIHKERLSIDHVIPRAWGKGWSSYDRLGNMLMKHKGCNEAKNDNPPTGCDLIWLMAVNSRLGVEPQRW